MLHKPNTAQTKHLKQYIADDCKIVGYYYVDEDTLRVWYLTPKKEKRAILIPMPKSN